MGFLFGKSRIDIQERERCSAYLQEELRISKLFEEPRNKIKKLGEQLSNAEADAQLIRRIQAKLTRIITLTNELIKERRNMTPIPQPAISLFTAWEQVYVAFRELARGLRKDLDPDTTIPIGPYLLSKYQEIFHKAYNEHGKLVRRLKLCDDEKEALLGNWDSF